MSATIFVILGGGTSAVFAARPAAIPSGLLAYPTICLNNLRETFHYGHCCDGLIHPPKNKMHNHHTYDGGHNC
jgi:hypothetical protein